MKLNSMEIKSNVFIVIVICLTAVNAVIPCINKYNITEGKYGIGGHIERKIYSIADCMDMCNNTQTCTGFDFSEDYGCYVHDSDIIASQGAVSGSKLYILTKRCAGKPVRPRSVRIERKTAKSLEFSWLAGYGGGIATTFKLYYQASSASSPTTEEVDNPSTKRRLRLTRQVKNLIPNTNYTVWIVAENEHLEPSESSEKVSINTYALPVLDESSISAALKKDCVRLSWDSPTGRYTELSLESCIIDQLRECTMHDLETNETNIVVPIDSSKSYSFRLMLFDRGVLILESNTVYPIDNDANLHTIVLASVFTVIVMAVIIALLLYLLVRHRKKKDKHEISGRQTVDLTNDNRQRAGNNIYAVPIVNPDVDDSSLEEKKPPEDENSPRSNNDIHYVELDADCLESMKESGNSTPEFRNKGDRTIYIEVTPMETQL